MRIWDGVTRAVVAVVTLSLTLVLLPIAINVGTGGTAPPFLTPYVGWVWPVIGALWLVLIVTGLFEVRSRRQPVIASRSSDKPRNRVIVLSQVQASLRRRVDGSLKTQTRLALALDQRPEVVGRPYDIVVRRLDGEDHQLPEGADVATVFEELESSMLILGAPGAGKTTLLLDLAGTLAARAEADPAEPIPVLVNLSGWTAQLSRRPDDYPRDSPLLAGFVRWLLDELDARYGLHPAAGRRWLVNGRFSLLLDGLDEVDRPHREKLASVLDELRMSYSIPRLAVTCRSEEYAALSSKLRVQGAVDIKPLTKQQVLGYFDAAGTELAGARAAIESDDELWELITTPLMLNVLLLAYRGRDPEQVETGEVRQQLFDTFIAEVLSRRRVTSHQYDAPAAVRALRTLAVRTRYQPGAQSVVPRWPLADGREVDRPVAYLLHTVCLPALLAGVVAGAALVAVAQYGVLAGLTTALSATLLAYRWPSTGVALSRKGLDLALAVLAAVVGMALSGVVLVAAIGLTGDLPFVGGVLIGLLIGWACRTLSFIPNYWQLLSHSSARWRVGPWVLGGALAGIGLAFLLGADHSAAGLAVVPGVVVGAVVLGALPRTSKDGGPLYRVLLDLVLCWSGWLPWRRRAFLRYAADRFVLARTGPGEYSFIHLLVRDHLAECNPEKLAAKVTARQA